MRALRTAGAICLLLAGACGAEQSSPPPAAPTSPKPVAPQPDLSPVAAPADIVVRARWSHPLQSVEAISKWTGVPVDIAQPFLSRAPVLAPLLDTSAPMDALVAFDSEGALPAPVGVTSIGLTSAEAAVEAWTSAGRKTKQLDPGVTLLLGGKLTCAVALARGPAKARLVCGQRQTDLAVLLPYATRGLAAEPAGEPGLRVEVDLGPVHDRWSDELSALAKPTLIALLELDSKNEAFDTALSDALDAMLEEASAVISDTERLELSVVPNPESKSVSIDLRAKLRTGKSWTAEMLMDHAARSGPAPELFWRLPKAAERARFSRGTDPERFATMRAHLGALLAGVLDYQGTPEKLRGTARELLADFPIPKGAVVMARGSLPPPKKRHTELGARDQQRRRQALGWTLIGVSEPSERYEKYALQVMAAVNDPVLGPQLKRVAGERRDPWLPIELVKHPSWKVTGVPKGTLALEVKLPATRYEPREQRMLATKKSALSVWLYVVPDGARTWLALGADDEQLKKALKAATAEKPGEATLTKRAGLDALREADAIYGGFTSVRALSTRQPLIRDAARPREQKLKAARAALPNGGLTPMVHTLKVSADDKSLHWHASVPSAALADAFAIVATLQGTIRSL